MIAGTGRLVLAAAAGMFLAGCAAYRPPRLQSGESVWRRAPPIKPVVAIVDMENKAGFSGQWNLGQGMADVLTTRLLETERVEVLDRRHAGDVIDEIVRQGQDLFRQEGRVERGRLKNAQYVIRGAVTDFTVTGDASGWFGRSSFLLRGRGQRARVAVHLRIAEVSSGEVIASVKAEGEASAGGGGATLKYEEMNFGGDVFFRTPLGKATEQALSRAIDSILRELPVQTWSPRVAESEGGSVIVNGGANMGLSVGSRFDVREPGRDVTDPATGNVLERRPGRVTGRIEIKTVREAASDAVLITGSARRGDYLDPIP